jgi:hypothetical protein
MGRGRARAVLQVSLVLVALAGLALVLASPLVLTRFEDGGGDRDWRRLSEIGQTYGAVSALLSALALGGVVVSLVLQRQSARLEREQAQRALHIELMRMAIENPDLQDCFGPFGDGLPETERRQWTYINQVVLLSEMRFEVGGVDEAWVRGSAYELFGSPISRRWWAYVRDRRTPSSRRRRRLHEILDEEWQHATRRAQDHSEEQKVLLPDAQKATAAAVEPDNDGES